MDIIAQLEAYASANDIEIVYCAEHESEMGGFLDDDMSVSETPVESEGTVLSAWEKQHLALQTYLNSMPYDCESIQEMQAKLEMIVGKIFICAQAQNWLALAAWDALLDW